MEFWSQATRRIEARDTLESRETNLSEALCCGVELLAREVNGLSVGNSPINQFTATVLFKTLPFTSQNRILRVGGIITPLPAHLYRDKVIRSKINCTRVITCHSTRASGVIRRMPRIAWLNYRPNQRLGEPVWHWYEISSNAIK